MRGYPAELLLHPAPGARGQVELPGSKSLSNRYLLLAALADGVTELHGLLASDDTAVMLDSLGRLGVQIERESIGGDQVLKVHGANGSFPQLSADLFVGNSGLTIRTLVPAVAASLSACPDRNAAVVLSGVTRMHERPIADLVDGLVALGASIDYLGTPGYPPLRLNPSVLHSDRVRVRGDTSSQFLTGLLQAAPLLLASGSPHRSLVIEVEGDLISKPYVGITLALMARFGVRVDREGWSRFEVKSGQTYRSPGAIAVEGDASSASYFLAAGAIGGGPV
ncbi:MAG: 3-phosphoshikimate 1-carboxyvinyltransferase, partial [Betaproteobacteria bacterium]|nr:3-phosphoshikimate 1-carboxyvinyltransferase [Betaproteobacteria bacterium]